MRSKVTVVLLFLNVVLFYYIYKYETVKPLDPNGNHVYGPEIAAIETLTRTTRAGTALRLERRGEAWWLTKPYEWPANPNAVSRLIKELQFLEHQTSFAVADLAKSGQTLADYGLDQPAITLTFVSAGKTYTSKIGDDTKIGNRLYLLSPDGARIHVVGRSLADTAGLPLESIRSDSIFTVPVFEVRSLNVQTANLKVRLSRKSGARWTFETPILARARKSDVEVTINTLNALLAKNFLEPAGADLERYGLNSPALRITLEGNARRETLLLGNSTGTDEYYAKIEDKSVIFTVPVAPDLLDKLRRAQEALRDTHVLDFEPHTVTALTLAAPGQPEVTLQRLESGTGAAAWQVVVRTSGQAPLTSPADTPLVEELLQKISLLAATKFLSDAPSADILEKYGFNRPEREITLNLNTGGGPHGTDPSTLALQVGVSPDKKDIAFARAAPAALFVYQIVPDILDETPVLARHYRQRLLRDLPEGARINGLMITESPGNTPVYSKQLTETQTSWELALAEEPEARRKAVGAALVQLHSLRAKRFTADIFNPDHADTAQGPRPWKYRLDLNIAYAGGNASAQNSTSTLFLTERLGGTTQLAGTAEFGGAVFEISQELLDALFSLTYRDKNDPGLPITPGADAGDKAPPPAAAPPGLKK